MTSKPIPTEAFVWVWLPHAQQAVVAGRLVQQGRQLLFNYGRSYLARSDAMALYLPELPLQAGSLPLSVGLNMPACIRDASPDAWGRRVLINRMMSQADQGSGLLVLDELSCLLLSGSNRIGALDFQASAEHYEARDAQQATLEELQTAADKVERGSPLPPALNQALLHGTSIGGARPKVMLSDALHQRIAKFASSSDVYSVVKAEFVAMRLAQRAGLQVAPVALTTALGKDVLLVERFDRERQGAHWQRKAMVSALTLLGLDEMMVAYASYEQLAEVVRYRFVDPEGSLQELFGRMVFNILCGNTDDHARNHAAFWDGQSLRLTPAYDICPQQRSGEEASQGMLICGKDRRSRLSVCLRAASAFLLDTRKAQRIIDRQIEVIKNDWDAVCDAAGMSEVDRRYLWGRQFLNPFVFQD